MKIKDKIEKTKSTICKLDKVWFTLESKSLQAQFRVCTKYENLYKVYDNIDFQKQPWFQLMYYIVCLLQYCNFRNRAGSKRSKF